MLAKKMTKEIKGKLAELYSYKAGRATTDTFWNKTTKKNWEYGRVSYGIHRL
jgi:hypothetical protein